MGLFKKTEPIEVNKKVVHDIRKELRPEYEHLRTGFADMELRLTDAQQIVAGLRRELHTYITQVDQLLEKLEE